MGGLVVSQAAGDISGKQLAKDRRVYLVRCARCHKAYNPADFETETWNRWMRKMRKKARVKSDEEWEQIKRYLTSLKTSKQKR